MRRYARLDTAYGPCIAVRTVTRITATRIIFTVQLTISVTYALQESNKLLILYCCEALIVVTDTCRARTYLRGTHALPLDLEAGTPQKGTCTDLKKRWPHNPSGASRHSPIAAWITLG